jgi:hypothetical protein
MEYKVSLPFSQNPVIDPYPESYNFHPHPHVFLDLPTKFFSSYTVHDHF